MYVVGVQHNNLILDAIYIACVQYSKLYHWARYILHAFSIQLSHWIRYILLAASIIVKHLARYVLFVLSINIIQNLVRSKLFLFNIIIIKNWRKLVMHDCINIEWRYNNTPWQNVLKVIKSFLAAKQFVVDIFTDVFPEIKEKLITHHQLYNLLRWRHWNWLSYDVNFILSKHMKHQCLNMPYRCAHIC